MRGQIVKALSGFYYVKTEVGTFSCRARGIFKKEGISPLVGDWVDILIQDEEEGVVDSIEARQNEFVRPPIANIDLFVTVISVRDPAANPEVLDRFCAVAEAASVDVLLCVNKCDLDSHFERVLALEKIYAHLYPVLRVSAATGEGIETLRERLRDRTAAFSGPSGVGKSSIIAALTGQNEIKTDRVSRKTGRGRNTTRHVEIFETDFGARIFDTPGYTAFEIVAEEPENLDQLFPELARLRASCRFDDCFHVHEPDCAVRSAVASGQIAPSRYASYVKMLEEAKKKGVFHA
ncbi:MAG: ribosome small subunit-dependent GTPase A [Clostridiales Family XIII bacterium]|nr:ribosome small subunit-dependent GTPase A [Clostridiales Family XIII bacterium]